MAIRSVVTPEVPGLTMTETKEFLPKAAHAQHHLIMRTVVPPLQANPQANRFTIDDIDQYINSYLREGWTLVNAYYIEKVGAEAYTFAWVLVR